MTLWQDLRQKYTADNPKMLDLFASDSTRADRFSARCGDLLFDYSKTTIDQTALDGLLGLIASQDVLTRRDAMFSGQKINKTENRAVLHTALRNLDGPAITVDGVDVMPDVLQTLARMQEFALNIRNGKITSSGGQSFTDVVNIGIGGSDLGPVMATLALSPFHDGPKTHFVSNVDGAHISGVLDGLNPHTTLVLVASKTFATIETMTNAQTAKTWLGQGVGAENISAHFAALSSALEKTAEFGIDANRVFGFEDWVGGRYSIWGPIGLPLMLAIGPDNFTDFLRGGQSMDRHFQTADPAENLPILLALVGLYHSHVCDYPSRAVLPYDQRLLRLPAYLQQLEMESNGKGVAMDGSDLPHHSGALIWGEPGTNGQHAFYQLIHQGTRVVPCEFMVTVQGFEPDLAHQHDLLLANCLAQSEALMHGRDLDSARVLMATKGLTGAALETQARHRVFTGNRPSTTLIYPKLTPRTLGQIIALYEHRVFVEGVILGINSFDQWGVELGKELAITLAPLVAGTATGIAKQPSTQMLLNFIQTHSA